MPFELFHQSIVSRAIVDCFKFLLYQKKKRKVLFNGDLENKNIWTSIKNVTKQ